MRRGVSLVELLLAVALLVAMLVPVFGSLRTGIQGTERVSEESIAANHATALLERLSQIPYRKLPEIPKDTPETALAAFVAIPGALPPGPPHPVFARFVSVDQVTRRTEDPADPANSECGNLKRIRVAVRWRPDYLGQKSERTLVFQVLVTDDKEVF
ncbi:MAG: hypothetical protein HY816_18590 [Candidatus Wallbacteria bacterium]|nr:hypothetical protein [Candidatus Wallbacteria bacterium]